MMGGGPMMRGGWGPGAGAGPGGCPGAAAARDSEPAPAAITEEKAKEIATEYVGKYFPGFTIERVLPFSGRLHTMYQVELKGPKGESRYLRVNPWGGVRPWGPPVAS
jgi:hypothetical protein